MVFSSKDSATPFLALPESDAFKRYGDFFLFSGRFSPLLSPVCPRQKPPNGKKENEKGTKSPFDALSYIAILLYYEIDVT